MQFADFSEARAGGYSGRYLGGAGTLNSATIEGATARSAGTPAALQVFIFQRGLAGVRLIRVVQSDSSGAWTCTGLNPDLKYTAVIFDPARSLNAAVLDNLTPVVA